jgi:hypothetical protein
MATAIVKGTWIKPGVSRNRRLYTREHIAKAVTDAQKALNAGEVLAMTTHHGARDPSSGDVTRTAGRITKVSLAPDGTALFEAELADTQAGREVGALVAGSHLKGVSMASMWNSEPRKINAPDGSGICETCSEGFTLKGIDFTHAPGVPGAQIHSPTLTEAAGSRMIFESLEEVGMTDTTPQPLSRQEQIRQVAATKLLEGANRALADPDHASMQDLAALAAMAYPK